MTTNLLRHFHDPWNALPTVWLDTETTGVRAGHDRAVQVGIARFEEGKLTASRSWLVNPGIPIPQEATAVHGITDEQVQGARTIEELFRSDEVRSMLEGAQPGAYNAGFDRHFLPPFGDWSWPWLDSLSLVRTLDRFVRGKGRHKLEVACQRHGIRLEKAHDAGADAAAAGQLFYKLAPQAFGKSSLGDALKWLRDAESDEWHRFNAWLASQPPREAVAHG